MATGQGKSLQSGDHVPRFDLPARKTFPREILMALAGELAR